MFVAFPMIAVQLWLFVAPGLYRSEKRALLPFLAATPILFVLGAALAYYFVFPFAWKFFASFQDPVGGGGVPIELLPRVSEYLDLVMKLIFAFGITFQLPVALTLLAKVGITSSAQLKKFRRYAYVGMFVIAAILAPPDVITQTGLAVPLDRAVRNLHHFGPLGRAEASRGLSRCTTSERSAPIRRRFDAAMASAGRAAGVGRADGFGHGTARRTDGVAGKAGSAQRAGEGDRPGKAHRCRYRCAGSRG